MAEAASDGGGFGAWLLSPKRRGALLVAPAITILFVMNQFDSAITKVTAGQGRIGSKG